MPSTKTVPLSLRLSKELTARLEQCASRIQQRKHTLAQDAIKAAVEAIEANDYRLVVPIEFRVTRVAAKVAPRQSPTDKEVGEAVAEHAVKKAMVEAIEKTSSPGLAPAGSSHTSGKGAIAPTGSPDSAPSPEPAPPSGQTKASGRTPERKRTRHGRKPK